MTPKLIFLIGPSGVGKSAVGKELSKTFMIPVFNTDSIIKERIGKRKLNKYRDYIGESQFFKETKGIIDKVERDVIADYVLFDIGSGSLDSNIEWFKKFYRICLIDDDTKKLLKRRKKDHESVDHYGYIEFSEKRKDLYNSSNYIINVGDKSNEEVAKLVFNAIHEIIEL
jgi:shikimate kinase